MGYVNPFRPLDNDLDGHPDVTPATRAAVSLHQLPDVHRRTAASRHRDKAVRVRISPERVQGEAYTVVGVLVSIAQLAGTGDSVVVLRTAGEGKVAHVDVAVPLSIVATIIRA